MSATRDRDRRSRQLDRRRGSYDLGLDAARREHQVDHGDAVDRGYQPNRGQATCGLLLQDRGDLVAATRELADQRFRVRVVDDGDREIDVASRARLAAQRRGQAPTIAKPRRRSPIARVAATRTSSTVTT